MNHNIIPAWRKLGCCMISLAIMIILPGFNKLAHDVPSEIPLSHSPVDPESVLLISITSQTILEYPNVTINDNSTISPTPTITASPNTSELVPPLSPSSIFLPLISAQTTSNPNVPPSKILFCSSQSVLRPIPDNNLGGVEDIISINDAGQITDLDVSLDISHSWVGDLIAYLRHVESGKEITLLRRPGRSGTDLGCGYDDVKAILDAQISSPVDEKCAPVPAAISGIYIPNQPLNTFNGENIAGTWILKVIDRHVGDVGRLNRWCLFASISDKPTIPTPTPTPPPSLSQARINAVIGKDQSLPLDCESRSAVDWAAYFGYRIDEIDFFSRLPHSDNPDKGFVGNVYGEWGQIPPNPYGVHAEPAASLLRDYGLQAYAKRPLSFSHLKAEISAGKPVIVWVIDSVTNGIPVFYTPSDGLTTIVARYEHTVIVIGYSNSNVYFLNGDSIYATPITRFLDSWSALGNMAIIATP